MKTSIIVLVLSTLCPMAIAQTGKWDIGINTGLGNTYWVENYSTSGPLSGPADDRVYKGDGLNIFVNASVQYKFGNWQIGPGIGFNEFRVGEIAVERNGQSIASTSRPAAIERATLVGLKIDYVWNLGRKIILAWGAEGGTLLLGKQNDFYKKRRFYLAGLQIGKEFGRWTPTLGIRYQKVLFDYPEYLFTGGDRVNQNVRSNMMQVTLGTHYRF